MSSKNDDTNAAAFIVAGLAAMAVFAFFVMAFVSFVLTILSIIAWKKPLHLGKICILPSEAHAFVKGGLIGAALLPLFLVFINVFFGIHIEWNYLPHMLAIGYTGGSLLVLQSMADTEGGATPNNPADYQVIPPPERKALPPVQREPFRYASWDDEEERN